MIRSRAVFGLTVSLAATMIAAGAAASATPSKQAAKAAKSPVKVGIIYSRTGSLGPFGGAWIEGFKFGLKYLTNGTNVVNGHELQIVYNDDATDPAKSAAIAKDLIGQGYKVIAGTTSSGASLQVGPLAQQNNVLFITGSASSDALTGLNRNTFRSGRQSYQEVLDAANFLPKLGSKKVVVLAEDLAASHSYADAVQSVFGSRGHKTEAIYVPFNTTDLTPAVQQLKNAQPDVVFVASWSGSNLSQMWQTLEQQGILKSTQVVSALSVRSVYQFLGPLVPGVTFISQYVYQAPKNKVNDWLVAQLRKRGQVPDLNTSDGWTTAAMLVRAVQQADGDDVSKMIPALEGYQFLSPAGVQRIRPQDHALIRPMFQVQLVKGTNGRYDVKVVKTVSPGNVQPPVKQFPS